MKELPWGIPGGQQVYLTPYTIAGRGGGDGKVTGSGALRSEDYVASSTGWRVGGDGNVEFSSGAFRGDISGASGSFSGTMSASNLTSGIIDATVIDVQNITANNIVFGTLNGAIVNVTNLNASNINSGTITGIAISGGTIDIGGSDTTSFHVNTAGQMWLGAASYASAPFRVNSNGSLVATNGTFTGTLTGSITAGTATITGPNVSGVDFTGTGNIVTNGGSIRSSNYVGGSTGWAIDGDGDAEFNSVLIRGTLDANSVTGKLQFTTDGYIVTDAEGANERIFMGYDSGLSRDILAFYNTSGTRIGYFDNLYGSSWIRFTGAMIFTGAVSTNSYVSALTYMQAGEFRATTVGESASNPGFTWSDDGDSGMYRIGANEIGFSVGGSLKLNISSTSIFGPGVRLATAGGLVVERYGSSGNELYAETSTRRLKSDITEVSDDFGGRLLRTRVKQFTALVQEADGTIQEYDPDRSEAKRGQTWERPGLIAEELWEDFPEACVTGEEGEPIGVDRGVMMSAMIHLLQEIDLRLDALEVAAGVASRDDQRINSRRAGGGRTPGRP